jgi:hypothetical protein
MIRGDSTNYELLDKWAKNISKRVEVFESGGGGTDIAHEDWNPVSVEIGVREGLGSKIIMDAFREHIKGSKTSYRHIGIDPYGNLKYQHYDDSPAYTADYTEEMRLQLEKDLMHYPEFKLYHMTDIEFMNRYYDLEYVDFVHFDGPHMTRDVLREAIFFADRARLGARFVFDDHSKYAMSIIANVLLYFNFKTIEMGENKCLLEKMDK